ncbi:MAG TPA: Ldh family oxidoreductase [Thermomicrobiaceae bacterium]|nr:Ldh family oxidoreductase [Thermomicrobiaceae bacterium]
MTTVWCAPEALERFVDGACRALGAPPDVAAEVAHHLVGANLAGHDSHGVLRLPWYAEQIAAGTIEPGARPALVRESTCVALFDGRRGFGHYATRLALEWTIEHARRAGIAAAAIRNFTHIGRLGEYAERGTGAGLVTVVTIGTAEPGGGLVTPFGGQERFLGTNPWAIGVPAAGRLPLIYDAATSTVAEGKVRVALAKGTSLPPDAILDRTGRPSQAPDDLYDGGMLLPLGGSVAGHKGYGFAMASALVGGLAMAATPLSGADGADGARIEGVLVLAMDPDAFGSGDTYTERTAAVLDAATRVSPAPGVARVLAPGEPEAHTRAERARSGVPLPGPTWQALGRLAARLRVELPAARVED